MNRYEPPATKVYLELFKLVKDKEYFVVTTNVEYQFHKAGFDPSRIWMVQGDYGYRQCAEACHETLYANEQLVKDMVKHTADYKIPEGLAPKCPVCGKKMNVYVHSDKYFIMGSAWLEAEKKYTDFIRKCHNKRVVYLELGVGYNTPGIIRYPFEHFTYANYAATLIRMNKDYPDGAKENISRTKEDLNAVVQQLLFDPYSKDRLHTLPGKPSGNPGKKAAFGHLMKQEKRLDFLLGFLANEYPGENIIIPGNYAEKRELMRALLNIRPPPKKFLIC